MIRQSNARNLRLSLTKRVQVISMTEEEGKEEPSVWGQSSTDLSSSRELVILSQSEGAAAAAVAASNQTLRSAV